jgi:hypothetical protein
LNEKLKVALIGNMNNNNFSIMRYFRDLGVDAYLVLTKEDGNGCLSHFIPENDTTQFDKWSPFIINTGVDLRIASICRSVQLKKIVSEFDICIGSGLTLSAFAKLGRSLEIFYPYGVGIEFIGEQNVRDGYPKVNFIKRWFRLHMRKKMIIGLKQTHLCICPESTLTQQTFKELNIPFEGLGIPMVYNNESSLGSINLNKEVRVLIDQYVKRDCILFFCHMRHDQEVKIHDIYLEGFAKFLMRSNSKKAILFLVKYGKDIDETKNKIVQLGISDNVVWLPVMSRREIIYILDKYVTFGFNNFEGRMWGGTGWEFLASGVPFFHYFNTTEEEFQMNFRSPLPPFFNTRSSEEICEKLIYLTHNKDELNAISIEMKKWFEKFGGIGLAKIWMELIIDVYRKNKIESYK